MMKPTLLFLSHRLPFPPHNGASIRTYNILRLLARHYDITALCFDRGDRATAHFSVEDRRAALASLGTFSVYRIPQEQSLLRLVWDHVRSLISGRAYTYYTHSASAFEDALARELASRQFDLVHVDSLDLVRHLDRVPASRTVLTHHNAEALLLKRRAGAEGSIVKRGYLAFQAARLAAEERRWVPKVGLNVVVSAEDRDVLGSVTPTAKFCIVPNGVDTEFFKPGQQEETGAVFVGGTSYHPNRDALIWFAAAILPELRRLGCAAPVTFVGRATDTERARYNDVNGLYLTGYVDDIRPIVRGAAVFIAPLRVGGGTRLKLVDAWAMGKAIVSTTVGCEGLAAVDGENMLIRDDPADFAQAVIALLQDTELRTRIAKNGRATAERVYSWDVIDTTIHRAYDELRGVVSASGEAVV